MKNIHSINKMDTYFTVLPNELKRELSLYLNYRDIVVACEFLNCENPEFWIHKIHNELGYNLEFIRDYVYDTRTGIQKTLLPLNEKYLELKSRRSIDFGTEFHNRLVTLLYRLSQLQDFELAEELLDYLFKFIDDMDLYSLLNDSVLRQIIRGAAGSGNIQLLNKIITLAYQKRNPNKLFVPKNFAKDYAKTSLIAGVYSTNPKGNPNLLKYYNILPEDYIESSILVGLSSGNYLQELLNRNIKNINDLEITGYEYVDNAIDVINYYKPAITKDSITFSILYGTVHLLPSPEIVTGLSEDIKDSLIVELTNYGYLEDLLRYSDFLTYDRIKNTVGSILTHNNLDVLNYLYLLYHDEIKHDISNYLEGNINHVIKYCLLETIKFLYNEGLLKKSHINLIRDNTKNINRQYNPEVLEYLQTIK